MRAACLFVVCGHISSCETRPLVDIYELAGRKALLDGVTQDCMIEETLTLLSYLCQMHTCTLLVNFCCIIGPTGSSVNKHRLAI